MIITENSNIGEIVAVDYRTAEVFRTHKIDFCCNGNRSLKTVCKSNNDLEELISRLNQAMLEKTQDNFDFTNWPLDLLADYIQKKHHRYVRLQVPVISAHLEKIHRVHLEDHPELEEVKSLFESCSAALLAHMDREEQVLFPSIQKLVASQISGAKVQKPDFGSLTNPIRIMMHEHDNEGKRFRRINELTNSYSPPADACSTYKITYGLLKEFEDDLHKHIHLENNILFIKSKQLESYTDNQIEISAN